MRSSIDALSRFMAKVDRAGAGECWQWLGSKNRKGYGHFWFGDGRRGGQAHRWIYEHRRGPIPDGLQIDHLCRNTSCVNPDHLEAVTAAENNARSDSPTALNARAEVCKYGHPLTPDNLHPCYTRMGQRRCWTCVKARQAEYRERKRARIASAI